MKIKIRTKPNISAMMIRPLWSVGMMTVSGADTVVLSVMAKEPDDSWPIRGVVDVNETQQRYLHCVALGF